MRTKTIIYNSNQKDAQTSGILKTKYCEDEEAEKLYEKMNKKYHLGDMLDDLKKFKDLNIFEMRDSLTIEE